MAEKKRYVDLNMQGQKITNLPAPTQNGDAATKQYVDSAGGSGADSDFLQLDGTAPTAIDNDLYKTGKLCLGTNVPQNPDATLTIEGPNVNDSGLYFSKLDVNSTPRYSADTTAQLGLSNQGRLVLREDKSKAILKSPIFEFQNFSGYAGETSFLAEPETQIFRFTGTRDQDWNYFRINGTFTEHSDVIKVIEMEPSNGTAEVTINHGITGQNFPFECPNDENIVLKSGDRIAMVLKNNGRMEILWHYRHNLDSSSTTETAKILEPILVATDLSTGGAPALATNQSILKFTGAGSTNPNVAWEGIKITGTRSDYEDRILVFMHEGSGLIDMFIGGGSTPPNLLPIAGLSATYSVLGSGARVVFLVKNGVAEIISIFKGETSSANPSEQSYNTALLASQTGNLTNFTFSRLYQVIFYDDDLGEVIPDGEIDIVQRSLNEWTFDYYGGIDRNNVIVYGLGV